MESKRKRFCFLKEEQSVAIHQYSEVNQVDFYDL